MLVVDVVSDLLLQPSFRETLQFCRKQVIRIIGCTSFPINFGGLLCRGHKLADINNGGTYLFLIKLLHIAVTGRASKGVGLRSINACIPSDSWVFSEFIRIGFFCMFYTVSYIYRGWGHEWLENDCWAAVG